MKKDSRIVRGEKTVHFFLWKPAAFRSHPALWILLHFSAAAFHAKAAVTLLFPIHCFNPLTSFQYSAKISEVRLLPFLCIFSWRTGHTRSGIGKNGAASLLAACGGKSDNGSSAASTSGAAAPNTTGATPLKEFISFESGNRELESWNMLYTQQATDANVITNLWDGLLSFDCYGKVVPAIASSWEHNDDSTVWTFHLRDDVDWVDANGEVKDHLTSKDFLVGFEWVMNSYKNEANNTSMPNDTVVGAADYYEQTKAAGDAAADMTYEDMLAAGVGIEAPDDYTLVCS